ncbi:peroxiredoxin [Lapillicoccus sp.]|uniref:peroxiredoxin n=1 Tax=Lapillicoccus sp. TaxID=1909287 RepID=UPI0027C102EC|nr:peroxiredoxin [Actinomycetota bacterium]
MSSPELPSAPLSVGDRAPSFALKNQYGEVVSLADFAGKKHVVLVFYPFAFSGICTGELRAIRDGLENFEGADIQVLSISCDSMYSLRAWADAEALFFPLLSDFWPHGDVAKAYGVFSQDKGFAIRGTFLVDADGLIRWTLVHGPGEARDFSGYARALTDLRRETAAV